MTFASPQAVSLPENVDPRRRPACSMDMSLAFYSFGAKGMGETPADVHRRNASPVCLRPHAQGILTVTPSPTASTLAGTGILGYNGDGGSASSAALAQPGAVAYDKNGNLYLADTNNNVVREITPTGIITTIAGTGTEGFSGDGGAATAAQLDTPTGVAVDASGNVYIADSHNNRIRKVSGGTIATFAGTGTPGFAGDGASAALPNSRCRPVLPLMRAATCTSRTPITTAFERSPKARLRPSPVTAKSFWLAMAEQPRQLRSIFPRASRSMRQVESTSRTGTINGSG